MLAPDCELSVNPALATVVGQVMTDGGGSWSSGASTILDDPSLDGLAITSQAFVLGVSGTPFGFAASPGLHLAFATQ